MKRNITIAAIAAAVLITGGSYTAFATGDGGGATPPASRVAASQSPTHSPTHDSPTHDSTDDHGGDRTSGTPTATEQPAAGSGNRTTASAAAAAALKKYPGTVTSIKAEDNNSWEIKVLGKDGRRHELRVNGLTGKVTDDHAGAPASGSPVPGTDDHGGDRGASARPPRVDDHPHGPGDDHGGDRAHTGVRAAGGHDVGDDHGGDRPAGGGHGSDDQHGDDHGSDDHGGGSGSGSGHGGHDD